MRLLENIFVRKPSALENNKIQIIRNKLKDKFEEIVIDTNHDFYPYMRAFTTQDINRIKEDCSKIAIGILSVRVIIATKFNPIFWLGLKLGSYLPFLSGRPIIISEKLFDCNDDSMELKEILLHEGTRSIIHAKNGIRKKEGITTFDELVVNAWRWSSYTPFYI